jgi:S-disulfanyl-L-cysteine oxidoreductase SoxD
MHKRASLLFPAAIFLASLGDAPAVAQAPAAQKTVWDGVYTDAQADRANGTFGANCARCHTLTPGDGRRPLAGDTFWQKHTQKTVGDLLAYVSANMPNGQGGSLSAGSYNDLMALILKSNGLPAGTTELTPEAVAKVAIVPKGGGSVELPANALARVVGCLVGKTGSDWTINNVTAPERIDKPGAGPEDATRPLGDRTMALKFVLSRLDANVGKRVSVSGILMGAGGANGINVTLVNVVGESCP